MYIYSFEKLEVWQLLRVLVKVIYTITNGFPSEEKFGLTNQVRRAAVSIVSNLAEGISRSSLKEQIRFIEIAYGSLMEVYCQMSIANDLNYIADEEIGNTKLSISEISNKLNALKNSYLKRL